MGELHPGPGRCKHAIQRTIGAKEETATGPLSKGKMKRIYEVKEK